MRLSDHIQQARGAKDDIGGIFTSVANAILKAERFELSDDVARAAYQLTTSKPTTLLSALPLCRAPYRSIWLEWRGGRTTDMIPTLNKRDPNIAPDPIKQGCLIETDETGQRGVITFAWVHKERPGVDFSPVNVAPLGTLFDWSEGADIHRNGYEEMLRRYPTDRDRISPTGLFNYVIFKRHSRTTTDDQAKNWMKRSAFHDWSRFANRADERTALLKLGKHAMPWVSPHALGFFGWCAEQAMKSEQNLRSFLHDIVEQSWEADIEGEAPFVDTVIAMMNSRNAIENRPVDLSALNKSRTKRGKPTFLPYRTTHLRLSQAQTRAFRAGLLSREDAGLHRVRGHFKIRKKGVYWWSPFFRGDPSKPLVERQEYVVR